MRGVGWSRKEERREEVVLISSFVSFCLLIH